MRGKQLFHNFIDIYIVFNDFEGLQEVLNQYHAGSAQDDIGLFAQGLLHIHNDHVDESYDLLASRYSNQPPIWTAHGSHWLSCIIKWVIWNWR